MAIKRISDKRAAELFHMTDRNLQQTYKNPKPTSLPGEVKKEISEQKKQEKQDQYKIIRLGATCKEHDISEELLLDAINFIKNIKK